MLYSTLVSFADIVNKLVEQCRGKPIVNIAYTELCVVYLEDIPQLIIGFFIVFCTGEDWGLLFAKTFVLLIGSLFGLIVIGLVVYYNTSCQSLRSVVFPEQSDDKQRKCGGFLVLGFMLSLYYPCDKCAYCF